MHEICEAEVELDRNTMNTVTKLLFKSHPYPSILNQLIEMYSGFIPDEAMYVAFYLMHAHIIWLSLVSTRKEMSKWSNSCA